MNIYEKLLEVQNKLKAPKNQYNSFGKYSYRSCEDILEALKPILKANKTTVLLTDTIKQIGDRYYLEATATFIDTENGEKISVKSLAREDESKKGMDSGQITGSVSSYARKYALNGLFCINDIKDNDFNNDHKEINNIPIRKLTDKQITRLYAIAYSKGIDKEKVKNHVMKKFGKDVSDMIKDEYDKMCEGYEKM